VDAEAGLDAPSSLRPPAATQRIGEAR
jgi:hypothetical protein